MRKLGVLTLLIGLTAQLAMADTLEGARGLLRQNNFEGARTEAAVRMKAAENDGERAKVARFVAQTYWKEKRYADCLAVLEESLRQYPNSAERSHAVWLSGYCLQKLGRPGDALEMFGKLAADKGAGKLAADAAARRAFLFLQVHPDAPTEAKLEKFRFAITEYPDRADMAELHRAESQLLWRRSEELRTTASKEEAAAAYRRLAELAPHDSEIQAFVAMNLVALTMEKERLAEEMRVSGELGHDFRQTVGACREFLATHPNCAPETRATVELILGEALYFEGKYEESGKILEGLAAAHEGNKACHTQVAFAYYMLGLGQIQLRNAAKAQQALLATLRFPDDANFAGNNVQAVALEWLGAEAIKARDEKLAREVHALASERYPESQHTLRLRNFIATSANEGRK